MKIGYLGLGVWGYCLARLLAIKGFEVIGWTADTELCSQLIKKNEHPKLPGYPFPSQLKITNKLSEAVTNRDLIVEGVTSAGIRPVFEQVKTLSSINCPIVITSKGIEQNSGLLLSEVIIQVLGEKIRPLIGCLSGPSLADEVVKQLPTSVVCSAYQQEVMNTIHQCFSTPTFRIYPNPDINGVELGGALKNIIAIACGISDGLGFGDNTKAALMTRGLHEMSKLAMVKGCKRETLSGLAGMGDLCVTCLSTLSRNYRFGRLIATGITPEEAKAKIGMVVEGMYTALSAIQLASKHSIEVPITEAVYRVLYEKLTPQDAVQFLLQRQTKEEHL